MEKYGVPRASMTEKSKAKLLKTNLERFGCVSSAQHQSVKDKALKTNLERYGHVATETGNVTNLEQYNNKDFIVKNFIKDGMFLKDEFMKYFTCSQVAAHNTLNRLGVEYNKYSSLKETSIEREVRNFLEEYNIKFYTHFRQKYELDFFLPDYNIGIELDGLYYHSYGNSKQSDKDVYYFKNKHILKYEYFKAIGIQVLFIWENEIKNIKKFEVWKSNILNLLGISPKKKIDLNSISFSILNDYRDIIEFVKDYSICPIKRNDNHLLVRYNNYLIGVIEYNFSNVDDLEVSNFIYHPEFLDEESKMEILKILCKMGNKNLIFSTINRFGRKYNADQISNIQSNHFIFKLGKAEDIQLNFVDAEEYYKDEGNYSIVYDFNLDFYDNLKLNGFNSLWDCGSTIYKIRAENL